MDETREKAFKELQRNAMALVRQADSEIANLQDALRRRDAWIADLQTGMYINCVYCGHRYGPQDEVPAAMADVLKAHVEQCPAHPMALLRRALEAIHARSTLPNYADAPFREYARLRSAEALDAHRTTDPTEEIDDD